MTTDVAGLALVLEPETDKLVNTLPFTSHGYIFKEVIGHGSYSVVFKVHHSDSKQNFAAKAIHIKYEATYSTINICDSEITALKQLCHPNIIKMYDAFHEYHHLFLILQLCDGGTVKNLVNPYRGLPYPVLVNFMQQILDAIDYCHRRGIAHRDIKPENIFIDQYGRPLVADFGFSTQLADDDERVNAFCGSFLYKSPEMLQKMPHCPFKADVWSLGVTFYLMAFGMPPWPKISRDAARTAIIGCDYSLPARCSENLAELLRAMIQMDPKQRPSCQELLQFDVFKEKIEVEYSRQERKEKVDSLPPLCMRFSSGFAPAIPANIVTAGNPVHARVHPAMIIAPRKPRMTQVNATDPIKPVHKRRHSLYHAVMAGSFM